MLLSRDYVDKEMQYMIAADYQVSSLKINELIAMGKQEFVARGELLRNGLNKELKERLVKVIEWNVCCAEQGYAH